MCVQQLAELVGKNLYQLSNLNGLNFAQYEQLVLPCVTEQIVQCGDRLAQQYLMEVRPPLLLCTVRLPVFEIVCSGTSRASPSGRVPTPSIRLLASAIFTHLTPTCLRRCRTHGMTQPRAVAHSHARTRQPQLTALLSHSCKTCVCRS